MLWDLALQVVRHVVEVTARPPKDPILVPILSAALQKEAGLLNVRAEDDVIRIFDIASRSLVRIFSPAFPVASCVLSPDARWLAVCGGSSHDSVKVYDIPSGQCLAHLLFPRPLTALAFSPRADFLATAHVGSPGIALWANALYFAPLSIRTGDVPTKVTMPRIRAEGELEDELDALEDEADRASDEIIARGADDATTIPRPLAPRLATLSSMPPSYAQTLLHLDLVQARNKPTAPPAAPLPAPFLLPTVPGLVPAFEPPPPTESRHINVATLTPLTPLQKFLRSGVSRDEIWVYLHTLSPSALDLAVRTLTHKDFEPVQVHSLHT